MKLKAFFLGFRDGCKNPFDPSVDLTWGDSKPVSDMYDAGYKFGQRVHKVSKT